MRLPGRLDRTTLGDVLGALYRARATGTLALIERRGCHAGREHRLVLTQGLVEAVESPLPQVKLGELLYQEGFLAELEFLRLGRELNREPSLRVGELLTARSWVSGEVVRAALRHQLRRRLDELFRLADAELRFHVVTPRARAEIPPLAPEEFLFGRPRARSRGPQEHPAAGASAEPSSGRPFAERSSPMYGRPAGRPHPESSGDRGARTGSEAPTPRRRDPVRQRACQTLGIAPDADRGAVARAFRQLARQVHPDRHPGASADERQRLMRDLARLSAAYHALVG
ncbi:MAG: J domain-containing protein [Polyangiaceae bacterium]|nr:J domain-containing protein [Polyangiaceae bacterium]MCW5791621.1 J domain-containing protein [Polyangiaceae bacterium]